MMCGDKTSVGCGLVLIRHEHTELAGTFYGQLDPPLSAQGHEQLKQLTKDLRHHPFVAVYSSDLRRAQQTAEAIAAPHHLPIKLRSDLRELAFGEWEGLSWEQVATRDPALAQRWLDEYPALAAPNGEPFEPFLARVQQAMTAIADEVHDGCAAVVTHAGVIRTVLASVTLERTTPVDLSSCRHGSWWEIRRQNRRWILHACSSDLQTGSGKIARNRAEVGWTA